jgi:hypothetical protein
MLRLKDIEQELHDNLLVLTEAKTKVEFNQMLTGMTVEQIHEQKGLFGMMDEIIFTAWTLHFKQPLPFFKSQIRVLSALCTVLVFCKRSTHRTSSFRFCALRLEINIQSRTKDYP